LENEENKLKLAMERKDYEVVPESQEMQLPNTTDRSIETSGNQLQ
jgi:hypothetical protein